MSISARTFAITLVAFAGCHQPQPTIIPDPAATVLDVPFQQVWESTKNVLRRHRFDLDRTDRAEGVITTKPVGSGHFFEFWRDDVATTRDAWEATLTKVRRRVSVKIKRDSETGGCEIVVTVQKQRFSTPERQITSTAAANHFLSSAVPAERGEQASGKLKSAWIDRGRDPAMEHKLRREILADAHPISTDGNAQYNTFEP